MKHLVQKWLSGTMESKWYCSLPWKGFSNDPDGRVRPCCLYKDHIKDENGNEMFVQTHTMKEIFSSTHMKDLRQQFRNGEKPAGCATCIKDENNGYTSKRLQYIKEDYIINYDAEPDLPTEYQMILSNACNLKCRSCTPSHSSLWQAEHKVIWGHTGYKMPHGQSSDSTSVLWKDRGEWMNYVERLEIVGGEPFYINKWRQLWDELIDNGLSKKIKMDMSTNCTIYEGDVLQKLIDNFKSIGIGLSVDGMGKTYEYLRHPGNWDEVRSNFLAYHDLQIRNPNWRWGVSVSHTIGWINSWELPEFHDFVKTETPYFKIWNNIIHYPPHMAVYMIPSSLKKRIEAKWLAYNWGRYDKDVKAILTLMNSQQPTDEELRNAYKTFKVNDKLRNECLLDILPAEIVEEIRPYYESDSN